MQEALIEAARQWPGATARFAEGVVGRRRVTPSWWMRCAAAPPAAVARRSSSRSRPTSRPCSTTTPSTCCSCAATPRSRRPLRLALTLRAVGGLTTAEIAAAFFVPESTMAQRISRAKQQLKASGSEFGPPPAGAGMPAYGWSCTCCTWCSTRATRRVPARTPCGLTSPPRRSGWPGCCTRPRRRAARLPDCWRSCCSRMPDGRRGFPHPATWYRWTSRTAPAGTPVTSRKACASSPTHWPGARSGRTRCRRRSPRSTTRHRRMRGPTGPGWSGCHDVLMRLDPSPVVALNRLVAVARVEGPRAALEQLAASMALGRKQSALTCWTSSATQQTGESYRKAAGTRRDRAGGEIPQSALGTAGQAAIVARGAWILVLATAAQVALELLARSRRRRPRGVDRVPRLLELLDVRRHVRRRLRRARRCRSPTRRTPRRGRRGGSAMSTSCSMRSSDRQGRLRRGRVVHVVGHRRPHRDGRDPGLARRRAPSTERMPTGPSYVLRLESELPAHPRGSPLRRTRRSAGSAARRASIAPRKTIPLDARDPRRPRRISVANGLPRPRRLGAEQHVHLLARSAGPNTVTPGQSQHPSPLVVEDDRGPVELVVEVVLGIYGADRLELERDPAARAPRRWPPHRRRSSPRTRRGARDRCDSGRRSGTVPG